jgi:hypothetical protein
MKTWTSALAAAAILAVAAPTGYAVSDNIPADPDTGTGHFTTTVPAQKLVKSMLRNKKQAATIKALIARNRALDAKYKSLHAISRALCVANRDLGAINWISVKGIFSSTTTFRLPSPPSNR